MTYGWDCKPTKAGVKHRQIVDGKVSVVYRVGCYDVTVPGKELPVTYRHWRDFSQSDPRQTLPNMTIEDGEMRIPVTDLVNEILTRLEPEDLARALFTNDDVKAAFMDCLVTRYNEEGVDDNDRRTFLTRVKDAVHDKALDRLANMMANIEFEFSRYAHHYHEIQRINSILRERGVTVERVVRGEDNQYHTETVPLEFDTKERGRRDENDHFTRGELEVGGKAWNEARNYWRAKVLEHFPDSPR